ncbi:hypothetical protein C2E23DRAFT_861597 [Lenzites betulinus]|nr:hypothetical protein C2E23DRAFT_861597 [Lenzites betulinus]
MTASRGGEEMMEQLLTTTDLPLGIHRLTGIPQCRPLSVISIASLNCRGKLYSRPAIYDAISDSQVKPPMRRIKLSDGPSTLLVDGPSQWPASRRRQPTTLSRGSSHELRRRVRAHNRRIKWFTQHRMVHVSRHALLFPVCSARPMLVLLPCRDDWDPACGCPAYSEDLDTDYWLEGAQSVAQVNSFPGTDCHLPNGYDIITLSSTARRTASRNATLRRLFSIDWAGSLLVVKRAHRHWVAPFISPPPRFL